MGRSHTTAALACALSLCAAAPAVAFQEMPVPPPPSPSNAQEAPPETKPPELALGTSPAAADRTTDSGGIQIFGYTLMPKLDFGLDLLYGQDQQQHLELGQGLTTFDADSDVTVLGKVKRRF